MTAQADLFDPSTEAYEKVVQKLRRSQRCVHMVLTANGPMTDEQLIARYMLSVELGNYPIQTESSIRSRRAELVKAGLVKASGSTKNSLGNTTTIWRAIV